MFATHNTRTRANRLALHTAFSLGLVFGPVAAVLGASPELVAQDRGPVQRTLQGKVEDKSGAGIKGAVVYLKNARTNSVKSAISDDDGSYRFVQLSQNTDYEIWAQIDSRKSKTKAISSFDSKNSFTIFLQIDK